MSTPTREAYEELQVAYDYFNRRLFGGGLPDCLITMQRRARTLGYFSNKRFVNREGQKTDEIALNPTYFASRTDRGVLSTLVHEMAHLWQDHFGTRGRRGYHCRQWANKMIRIGLYPSSTGQPEGREIGYHMSHYIVEGGPFDEACKELLATGFRLPWLENLELLAGVRPVTSKAVPGDSSNRWKYTCPQCLLNAWARPNVSLVCGQCHVRMPRNVRGVLLLHDS